MSDKLQVTYRSPEEMTPYANNARTHSEEQITQIMASIKEFGFVNPILVDERGVIIAGHGRLAHGTGFPSTALRRELQALSSRAKPYRPLLASYQATLDGLQADTAAKITALEAEGNRQTARVRNLERLLGQIEGASDEKNGIVAPVLRDAIDGLYGTDPSSKADKAGGAAKPSDLRGRAAAAKR